MSPRPFPVPLLAPDHGEVLLRPWEPADAPALAAAWTVADIAAQASVPEDGSVEVAARWIDGTAARAAEGRALDLVIAPRQEPRAVWGEVGLARIDLTAGGRTRHEVEIGWWVAPERRGRGVATAAAQLLVTWTIGTGLATRVVARIAAEAVASRSVAAAIGLVRVGPLDGGRELWAGPADGSVVDGVGRSRDGEV